MKNDFALRASDTSLPVIRVVDAYMREDPTFLAFAEGNPAIEACPADAIREIANDLLLNHSEEVLLYSSNKGDAEFRDLIMKRLAAKKGVDPSRNDVMVLTGGQQGLYLAPRILVNEGDAVLEEEITYTAAIGAKKTAQSPSGMG